MTGADQPVSVPKQPDRASAWSRYWGSGARHSCAGSFSGYYGEATQAFWRAVLSVDESSSLLELGCGNGALIRFLSDEGIAQRCRSIIASDLARISSDWIQDLPESVRQRLQVMPEVSAEALPLPDRHIQTVVAQYAVEYFASATFWCELDRVAASDARLVLVTHHHRSRLVDVARTEVAHADWLLQSGGLIDLATLALPYFSLARSTHGRRILAGNDAANAARGQLNQAFADLSIRADASPFSDLLHEAAESVMRLLGSCTGDAAGDRIRFDALRQQLMDGRLRAKELIACALTDDGIRDWTERLSAIGFQGVAVDSISEHGQLFGWTLVGRRDLP